ncbi:MAG TPA: nucleotidyltransferase family protein [Opitutus sp.]|nr:nucleotidyltransferase family protein [Opitutus sp.]
MLPVSAEEWSALAREAARQRVGPFLLARLPHPLSGRLPPPFVHQLERSLAVYAAHAARQRAELQRAIDLLTAAGTPVRCLKGPLLSTWLYGSPDLRHASDLDLLVRDTDVSAADSALRAAGYRRTRPSFELSRRQERVFRSIHREYSYIAPDHRLVVELLWHLETLTPAVWENRATLMRCDGRDYPVLAPNTLAAYLCAHGARHGWCRLFWLLDVALLLRHPSVDWSATLALAQTHGSGDAVLQAALLAERLLGATPPAALRPASRAEARRVVFLATAALRQFALAPADEATAREWVRDLLYRLRLARGWRRKIAVLRPHLLSLATWEAVRLPDRWFHLYYVLTPPLWLLRRLRRSWRRRAAPVTSVRPDVHESSTPPLHAHRQSPR